VNSASSAAFSCSKAAAAAASVSSSTLRIAACISSADKPPPDVAAVAVAAAVLVAPVCDHQRQQQEGKFAVEGKEENFMLFGDRNGGIPRRQPRAMLSKSGTASLCNVSVSVILLCIFPGPGAQFERPSRLLCMNDGARMSLWSKFSVCFCRQSC